ncbi:small metal-binding protein SmbP [Nitrosomonas supralitoralis]|uniref:Metal-binding protein SmbP n=1 Tax=Nitrosomonas supralitoralis TaxID=2116706 RepID=A0A2P7NWD0_9PROT|nr:small metal-binding protein SmbP [Nitrosomonas supralitoralis]PSJ17758.1 metal-binding protein SmbP [Nitrosomonas supralitoralis]
MKAISTIIAMGILALFLSAQASASDAPEKMKAMEHIDEAIKHGKMGHAKELLEHAKESRNDAKAALAAGADAHMEQAVKHLDEAIKHAEMGHADEATKHAEEAHSHMHESGGRTHSY